MLMLELEPLTGGARSTPRRAPLPSHLRARWWCRAAAPARGDRGPGGLCRQRAGDGGAGRGSQQGGLLSCSTTSSCVPQRKPAGPWAAPQPTHPPLNEGVGRLGQQDAAQQQHKGGHGGQAQRQAPAVGPVLHSVVDELGHAAGRAGGQAGRAGRQAGKGSQQRSLRAVESLRQGKMSSPARSCRPLT